MNDKPRDEAEVAACEIGAKLTGSTAEYWKSHRIADIIRAAYADQTAEVELLRAEILELVNAVDALGNALFGPPDEGHSWRLAKAGWWQSSSRLVQKHEAAEAAKGKSDG